MSPDHLHRNPSFTIAASRMDQIESRMRHQRWLIAALAVVVLVCATGWWLTSQGLQDTQRSAAETERATAETLRSAEIAACRSEQRVQIIDRANDALEATRVTRDDLLVAGLVAVVTDDDELLDELVRRVEDARGSTAAALAAKEQATEHYAAVVELSRTDPDAFLQACRNGG